jgi:DNA-binding SARP family transcriptional activator/pimeloyl-ACP methyl ester carboxylesterase
VEFRLLGPLEASAGSVSLDLGGPRQRALLARLLLDANRAVSVEQLVDDLWGAAPPPTAVKSVQVYVSRLRKVLPAGTLETRSPGYRLLVGDDALDLTRFERLAGEGRAALAAGDAEDAAAGLRDALALWRGPALVEFAEPFAAPEALRLEELRLTCLEDRVDADLALGRHVELVAELEALVARHALRERLRRQLMVALYRSGRQAEALESYRAYRQMLGEELGLEPSPELRELERGLLRHDRALSAPARAAPAADGGGEGIRHARSGDVGIAYQVVGDGPLDLVLVHGWVCTFQPGWENPKIAHFYRRLAGLGRLILFDKRGTGLSDRVPPDRLPDLETRMDDVRAVLDAVGSPRAVLVGVSEGGPMSTLFAATYPERTAALVLIGTFARQVWAPDYPIGLKPEELQRRLDAIEDEDWARTTTVEWLRRVAPVQSRDPEAMRWYLSYVLRGASPGAARALRLMNARIDVRPVLPAIAVPTVVLYRSGEYNAERTRFLGEHIPGAETVELPGDEHLPWEGDEDALLDEIERFLAAVEEEASLDRVLVTVLFTDIAGSTARAAAIGDRAWAALLERHHAAVRAQLARFRGREIDLAGDGFLAVFDGPARAIRCAQAIQDVVRPLGLELRAGLHTGEVELVDGGVRGIAVHTGARVASLAAPGEVLVTRTVRDLVAGSGLEFDDRGEHTLDGVPGAWPLLAVRRASPT